jgi:hypothetical protein
MPTGGGYNPFGPLQDAMRIAVPLVINQRNIDAEKQKTDALYQLNKEKLLQEAMQAQRKVELETSAKMFEEAMKNVDPTNPESVLRTRATASQLEKALGKPILPRDEAGEMLLPGLTWKKPEMTEYQKESLSLREQLAKQAQADREEARADRMSIAQQASADRAAALGLQRENLDEKKKQNLRGEQGTKPEKGMRWNADTGEMEPIPGSSVDIKMRENYAADTANISRVEDSLNRLIKAADTVKNHEGLDWLTGYTGYLPDWVSQSKRDAATKLDELKSKNFVQAVEAMRSTAKTGSTGLGQLTEREGEKVQNSIANLERAQSTKQIQAALDEIKSIAEVARTRIKRQYETEWKGREPKALGQKQDWKPENLDLKSIPDDDLKKKLGISK